MSKYLIEFWFEFGGYCFWSRNEAAKERFTGNLAVSATKNENLPISKELNDEISDLFEEWGSSIDWDYPPNPSPWTEEHKIDFNKRAFKTYKKIQAELGEDFTVIYNADVD